MNNIPFDNLEFGEQVLIYNKLNRTTEYIGNGRNRHAYRKWKEVRTAELKGIYLGKRTLSNGKSAWYSDHVEYIPQEYISVALVVVNPNENPFYSTSIEKLWH